MSVAESAPPQPSTPEAQVVDVLGIQDRVGLTASRYQVPQKIEKFARRVRRVANRAAMQEGSAISVIANGDQALIIAAAGIAATGLSATSGLERVQVTDPRSGNMLNLGRAGYIEHGNEEAGLIEVSLGDSLTTGKVTVTPLEVTTVGQLAQEALVPVSLMDTQPFIPSAENMPTIRFVGDLGRVLGKDEVIKIGPEALAVAAVAAAARLFRLGESVEVDSGFTGLSRVITPGTGEHAGKMALGELAY